MQELERKDSWCVCLSRDDELMPPQVLCLSLTLDWFLVFSIMSALCYIRQSCRVLSSSHVLEKVLWLTLISFTVSVSDSWRKRTSRGVRNITCMLTYTIFHIFLASLYHLSLPQEHITYQIFSSQSVLFMTILSWNPLMEVPSVFSCMTCVSFLSYPLLCLVYPLPLDDDDPVCLWNGLI